MDSNDTNLPLVLRRALSERGWNEQIRYRPAVGGDTASSGLLTHFGGRCFVKIHPNAALLAAEEAGLRALEPWLRVPQVQGRYADEVGGVLFLEALALEPLGQDGWRAAGQALAGLQRGATHTVYGGVADNFIGGMVQHNGDETEWPRFFARQRLQPQLQWATQQGLPAQASRAVGRVIDHLPHWLPHRPVCALLHGDLWMGNLGQLGGAEPVFFDPACYYGDPQVDLAMLNLFGRPPEAFYHGYQGHLPTPEQRARWPVYDLYHWLNHFNLFGHCYASAVTDTARLLCRELE